MTTRREFLALTVSAAGAAKAPRHVAAAPNSMTVVRESPFIKPFDDYFAKTLPAEYEKTTGIKIVYEATSVGGMLTRLTTIAETKSGPEIAMTALNWPHLSTRAGPERVPRRADLPHPQRGARSRSAPSPG